MDGDDGGCSFAAGESWGKDVDADVEVERGEGVAAVAVAADDVVCVMRTGVGDLSSDVWGISTVVAAAPADRVRGGMM